MVLIRPAIVAGRSLVNKILMLKKVKKFTFYDKSGVGDTVPSSGGGVGVICGPESGLDSIGSPTGITRPSVGGGGVITTLEGGGGGVGFTVGGGVGPICGGGGVGRISPGGGESCGGGGVI